LTANSLNAEDGAVWKVADDVFQDLGAVERSLPRRIDGLDLLEELLVLVMRW
jgi:hypothetical protein